MTIKKLYRQSKIFLIAEKISEVIGKIIFSSFFYKIIFHESGGEKIFSKSFVMRIFNFFVQIFLSTQNFFADFYETSLCKKFLDSIFTIYVPKYALSAKSVKFLSEFFGIEIKKAEKKSGLIFWLIVLTLFIFCAKFFSVKKYLLVIAISFALLIFYNVKMGIFALVFFTPILPTKFILAIVLLTVFSFVFNLIFTHKFSLRINLTDLFVVLFATLIFYSSFISYIPNFKMSAIYLLFIAFYFVFKNTITNKENLFTIASLMITSSAIVALIGIAQKYFGLDSTVNMWIDENMFEGNTTRVFSTLANPNVLGEYLLFMIPITFGSIYYFKNKFCKIISFLITCLLGFCMLLTLSRGAWLGLIVAMIIFILLRDKKLLLLGFFLILIAPLFIPNSFLQRFMSIGNMADTSTSYRVGIWIGSLRMIKDFWPIGIGLGSEVFIFIFQKYALSASYALHSHNFYLQILIDLGIAGLILILCVIFSFYKNLLANNKFLTDNFVKTFKISLCAGFTGYLIQGLADNVWYNYRIFLLFWIMIAISSVCFNLSELKVWEKFKFYQHKTKFN